MGNLCSFPSLTVPATDADLEPHGFQSHPLPGAFLLPQHVLHHGLHTVFSSKISPAATRSYTCVYEIFTNTTSMQTCAKKWLSYLLSMIKPT